jgi:hypothetical protein
VWNVRRTQQPYDAKLLSDSVREDFCVPDLSQQEKNLAIFNSGHRLRQADASGHVLQLATGVSGYTGSAWGGCSAFRHE